MFDGAVIQNVFSNLHKTDDIENTVQQRQQAYRNHGKAHRTDNQSKDKKHHSVLHRIGHDCQRHEQEQASRQTEYFS